MLRITVREEPSTVALILEGKLAGDWVPELKRLWWGVQSSSSGRRVVLILTELCGIDDSGRLLLKEIFATGTELKGSGIGINALIKDISNHKVV